MASPTVSVLLPTYNAEAFVTEAIESLLSGHYDDFEILVIDDNSTDGTVESVRAIDDDRLRLIQRRESGLVGALNRGISEARGRYIARQDADDRSRGDRLEKQVAFLDDHTDVAVVGSGAELVTEKGTKIERRHVYERLPVERLLDGANLVHGSVLMRGESIGAVGGYDEFFAVSEDYDLWLRLADRYRIRNIDEPLYTLRLHGESIYGAQLRAVKLYAMFARKRIDGSLPQRARETVEAAGIDGFYERLTPSERARIHREMALELLRYGDREGAREEARRVRSIAGTDVASLAVTGLTFAPRQAVRRAGRAVRAVKNTRIRAENRRERG